MANCPNCGNQTGEGAVFCDQCGTRLAEPEATSAAPAPAPAGGSAICPACGAGNVPGEAFCDYCGSPLEPPAPTVQEPPEIEAVASAEEPEVPAVLPATLPVPEAEEDIQEKAETELEPVAELAPEPAAVAEAAPEPEKVAEAAPEPEAVAEVAPELEAEAAPALVDEVEAVPAEPDPSAEEEVAAGESAPASVAAPACPACGTEVEAGDTFCSNCGYTLKAPVPAGPAAPPAVAEVTTGPRLVVVASGAEIPLAGGEEILIGREDPVSGVFPDVDLTPHGGEDGGVSRRHARIIIEGGSYFVEDLDSTNFTFVNRQKLVPKTRQPVGDGDEIRCGRVPLVLKTS